MNWKKQIIEDLRDYPLKLEAMYQIPEKIKRLEDEYTGLKSARNDSTPVSGSTNKREDALVNNIVERDKLKLNYSIIKRQISALEKGLELLTDTERLILDRFYIHGAKGNIDRLKDELGYEKSQLYCMRNDALRKLTIGMYGVVEL